MGSGVRTGLFETQTPTDPHTGRTIKQFYGQRMRGLFRPLRTGTYHFWLASDDDKQLAASLGAFSRIRLSQFLPPSSRSCRRARKT